MCYAMAFVLEHFLFKSFANESTVIEVFNYSANEGTKSSVFQYKLFAKSGVIFRI